MSSEHAANTQERCVTPLPSPNTTPDYGKFIDKIDKELATGIWILVGGISVAGCIVAWALYRSGLI